MNKSSQLGSVSSSDLIDAKLEEHQLCGSKHCPGCGHKLEGKPDWVGLPAGVKFDPTDQELIEHLEAKVEGKESKSHPLIDEFIPTIEGEDGICYTHPEKLPGVTRDGLSRHFFHRPSKAYHDRDEKKTKNPNRMRPPGRETRWHKTGKTRPVMVNGKQKGCKKILVLYTNFGKNRKPEKTNWVMHQYHLGQHEEEREGELVVSKIFYQTQPRQCNWSDRNNINNNINNNNSNMMSAMSSAAATTTSGSGWTIVGAARLRIIIRKLLIFIIILLFRDVRRRISHLSMSMSLIIIFPVLPLIISASSPSEMREEYECGRGFDGKRRRGGTCEERDHQMGGQQHHVSHEQHHVSHHQTAYHVSRPSHSISTIISPPPLHHTTSIDMLDQDHHSFHVPTLMLPNQNFQQQQEEQHNKLGGRSASGLEELIMGCTSSSTDNIKQESSMANPQEAEWLKYSNFWPDPDNPDHHG